MTVKELIIMLLDEPMNAEIYVGNREKHIDERFGECSGYMFEIDDVERRNENCRIINFTDWRKVCGIDSAPSIKTKQVKYFDDDEKVWKIGEVIINNSEKPNNCEHITEDGVTCAKYPACDDCISNPLNKVKGSEKLVKGSEQTDCQTCKWWSRYGYCVHRECKGYAPQTERSSE